MNNSVKFFVMGMVLTLALVFVILAGIACKDTTPGQNADSGAATTGSLENYENIVIASVGDKNFTLADLLKSPQLYMIIHDQMIVPEIIQQEALSRGLTADPQKIDTQINQIYEQAGGMQQFLDSNVPPTIPQELVPDDVRKTIISQELQQLIVQDRYEKEHGASVDAEITAKWDESPDRYQRRYVEMNPSVVLTDVTLDMVRSLIDEDIKAQWINEHGATLAADLEANYTVKNFLLDAILASIAGSETEESAVEVPPVDENSFPYEQTQTSGGETEGQAVGSGENTDSGNEPTEPEPNPGAGSGQ
ncbi:MAG: hypothetical protein NTY09_08285 [bacterium]|nr:hypothetical protein [bacterium]